MELLRRWIEAIDCNLVFEKMDAAALVHGQTEFTINLHKAVVKGKESDNVVLSPLSIGLALGMVAAGANGPTLTQISKCIQLPEGEPMHQLSQHLATNVLADGSAAGGPQVALANRVWFEQSLKLKPQFQKILKDFYGSEAELVDFHNKAKEALTKVNEWAKNATHGKINDLLPPGSVDQDTRLVLANALYFKGAWAKTFDSYHTREEDFFLLDGKTIKVPMMHTTTKQYVKDFSTFKALRLPYKSGSDNRLFSMFILLPHEKKGLADLEKALDLTILTEDLKQVNEAVTMKKFALPKFKVACGFEVPQALQDLGLKLPFENQADLTGMVESVSEGKLLYVSNVYHKTFVEVNEEGTEAAAATALAITTRMMEFPVNPTEFVCDHPFFFVIKEEHANVILFTGRVTNPSTQE